MKKKLKKKIKSHRRKVRNATSIFELMRQRRVLSPKDHLAKINSQISVLALYILLLFLSRSKYREGPETITFLSFWSKYRERPETINFISFWSMYQQGLETITSPYLSFPWDPYFISTNQVTTLKMVYPDQWLTVHFSRLLILGQDNALQKKMMKRKEKSPLGWKPKRAA